MLKHLTIKNYTLIRELEIDPSTSLNVVTGETGAGKSIMLGALGLLMGNRADTKVLWDENEKCITEGVFDISGYKLRGVFKSEDLDYDETTVMRREISPGGKSRAFINDTPVTLEVMRKISSLLLDVHSQHETLLLGQQAFQLKLVDAYAENDSAKEAYDQSWEQYVAASRAYEQLKSEADSLKAEADYIRFQLNELIQARLDDVDQGKLESELKIMEHAEEIKQRFNASISFLSTSEYAARNIISEARSTLQAVSSYATRYESLVNRVNSLMIELDDIIQEMEKEETAIEFDPERAEMVKEQINTLYRLLKKHRMEDVSGLLQLQQELKEKASITDNVDEALATRKRALDQAIAALTKNATTLSDSRKKTFGPLSKAIVSLLKELGIPNASFTFDHSITEPSTSGIDKIEILFSANKGIAAKPLAQVASGGEFARVMFSIKHVMAERQAMPTLVLDEIDTGVSGEIAIKLGILMKAMAKRHQVIAISHLPQIAAKADAHFFVSKDNSAAKTVSIIKKLNDQERVNAIAEMIGGAKPSKTAIDSAKELINSKP
jgi:DNA repair protein RecN (Recombination protein N)